MLGPAQLSPVDENLCAYFVGGNSIIRLHWLEGPQPHKMVEMDVSGEDPVGGIGHATAHSSGPRSINATDRNGAGEQDTSVGSVAATTAASIVAFKREALAKVGRCLYADKGRSLYCLVKNRRVLKLNAVDLQEITRYVTVSLKWQKQLH